MTYLLFHVGDALALLEHQTGVGVTKIMEPNPAKFFTVLLGKERIKLPRAKVVLVHETAIVATKHPFWHQLALLKPRFFPLALKQWVWTPSNIFSFDSMVRSAGRSIDSRIASEVRIACAIDFTLPLPSSDRILYVRISRPIQDASGGIKSLSALLADRYSRPNCSLTPTMARRGSVKTVGRPKFGLYKLSAARPSSALLLSTFSTSRSSSTRPKSRVTTVLDTRRSSSDCDESRRAPRGSRKMRWSP